MAEFSFPNLTPEVISATILEAAQHLPANDTLLPQASPMVIQFSTPLPVTQAKNYLDQARAKSPPNRWRYFFRAMRRQPRVNGLIFRALSELIKIARRSNQLAVELRTQLDLARDQTADMQERFRRASQTVSEQRDELVSLRQALARSQEQEMETIVRLEKAWSAVQDEQREELARTTEVLAKTQSEYRELAAITQELAKAQSKYHEEFTELIRATSGDHSRELCRWREEVHSILETQRQNLEQQHARLVAMVEQARQRTDSLAEETSALGSGIHSEINEMRARLLRADRSLRELRRKRRADSPPRSTSRAKGGLSQDKAPTVPHEFDYFMFEQRFRGETSVIKQRQESYVDPFCGKKEVVDLGCGRGEFVELLTEKGISVTGVDINREMVEYCQARGLKAMQADLFEYLESKSDRSIDGIFAAQVIEHLASNQIIRLIELAARKLQPGGVMVAETVNPSCTFALGNFYLDPTHVKPVPFGLLQFMFEEAAFEIKEIRFSGPAPEAKAGPILLAANATPADYANYQDYAVIAVRPA